MFTSAAADVQVFCYDVNWKIGVPRSKFPSMIVLFKVFGETVAEFDVFKIFGPGRLSLLRIFRNGRIRQGQCKEEKCEAAHRRRHRSTERGQALELSSAAILRFLLTVVLKISAQKLNWCVTM